MININNFIQEKLKIKSDTKINIENIELLYDYNSKDHNKQMNNYLDNIVHYIDRNNYYFMLSEFNTIEDNIKLEQPEFINFNQIYDILSEKVLNSLKGKVIIYYNHDKGFIDIQDINELDDHYYIYSITKELYFMLNEHYNGDDGLKENDLSFIKQNMIEKLQIR